MKVLPIALVGVPIGLLLTSLPLFYKRKTAYVFAAIGLLVLIASIVVMLASLRST